MFVQPISNLGGYAVGAEKSKAGPPGGGSTQRLTRLSEARGGWWGYGRWRKPACVCHRGEQSGVCQEGDGGKGWRLLFSTPVKVGFQTAKNFQATSGSKTRPPPLLRRDKVGYCGGAMGHLTGDRGLAQ